MITIINIYIYTFLVKYLYKCFKNILGFLCRFRHLYVFIETFDQWCSLVFCSEYTVIFFLPSLKLIRTRAAAHNHTTLTKQGSMLTLIFRSTYAAN